VCVSATIVEGPGSVKSFLWTSAPLVRASVSFHGHHSIDIERNRLAMTSALKRVCVFTGSRVGTQQEYALGARKLARQLVQRGYGLVYGGGKVGLMTIIADHVLELGGHAPV
jgi:hypothetical protein